MLQNLQIKFIKSVLELPGNTSSRRLIFLDFKVDVDQSVVMLESLFEYSVTKKRVVMFADYINNFIP